MKRALLTIISYTAMSYKGKKLGGRASARYIERPKAASNDDC